MKIINIVSNEIGTLPDLPVYTDQVLADMGFMRMDDQEMAENVLNTIPFIIEPEIKGDLIAEVKKDKRKYNRKK